MPATITFNTIGELVTYIDQYIKVNHNNEITGEQHNNVENGLVSFIVSSPRNYNKAYVTSAAAAFVAVAAQCILIFKTGATGSIQLIDNRWNEWVIYNKSGVNKQLVGSINSYKTNTGQTKNYISSGAIVNLAKGNDNVWYEIDNGTGGSGSSVAVAREQFTIGDPDSLMVAGETELIITTGGAIDKSEEIFLDGSFLYKNLNDRISYSIVYSDSEVTITFNQAVSDTQVYLVRFLTQ